MVLFQNCAKTEDIGNAEAIEMPAALGTLKVASSVQLNDNGLPGANNSLRGQRSVNPTGFDFGPIASDFTYQFPYHLNLVTGEITARDSDAVLGELTQAEQDELSFILDNAILANKKDYLDPDIMCAAVMVQGYANLQTDQGEVIVGAGTSSCDIVDLFKDDDSGQEAGLQQWLEKLQDRLPH